jgi:hypothetical protein
MTEGSREGKPSKTPESVSSTVAGKYRRFFRLASRQVPDMKPLEDPLSDSVARAKLLLAFASQGGIPIVEDDLNAVLTAEKNLKEGNIEPAVEAAFWIALSKLAVAVRPVTVASLQDTALVTGYSKIGLFTNQASKFVAFVAMATLAVIIVVQIQAVQLSSRIQGFDDLVAKSKVSADAALKLWVESRNAILSEFGGDPATKAAAVAKTTAANAAWEAAYGRNFETLKARASAAHLLEDSKQFWMIPHKPYDHSMLSPPPPLDSSLLPELAPALPVDEYRHRQEAQNQYDVLYRLILPALYGLLGSCIFVLRSVSSQLENFTFTWTRRLLGSARLTLGPILGVASLVLIDPSKTDALGTLPQIAIALIAGYSVDLVLNFMDKLTSAFGQPSTSGQTTSGKP